MSGLNFEDMESLFDKDDDNFDIIKSRKNLYTVSRTWMKETPIKTNVKSFEILEGVNRYCIENNQVEYECLFFPSKAKKLYISLCGGGRAGKKYPVFLRWKYINILDGNYLCIDDPMYNAKKNKSYAEKTNGVLWYYGTKEMSYLKNMLPIIEKFMTLLNVAPEDIVFFGSSGGATAAIYLANLLGGSTAYALNPQYDLAAWKPQITKYFNDVLGIDLTAEDDLGRNKIDITNSQSSFFLVENIASKVDYDQCFSFFKKKNIPLRYGISQYGNIVTWVHCTNGISAHSSSPEKFGFYFLNFLNKQMRKGSDINTARKASFIINEILNEKYEAMKTIDDLYSFQSKMMKIFYMYINKHYPMITSISKYEAVKFDMTINGIDDIYYRIYFINKSMYIYCVAKDIDKYEKLFGSLKVNAASLMNNAKEIYFRRGFSEDNYEEVFAEFISDTLHPVLKFSEKENKINEVNISSAYKIAHQFRNEGEIQKGNRIIVVHKNGSREEVDSFPKMEIEFKGKNGLVEVHETVKIKNKIKVFMGERSFLHLDRQVSADSVSLNLTADDTTMWVGERSWLRTLRCICNAEPGMEIIMGKDIVMSLDVLFRPTDGHTIIDLESGAPINMPKFGIHVDDHVGLGQSVTLLKDTHIPRDCVVGAHSLVGKKDFFPNSIIAGIPAKAIKSGITWDEKRIHDYISKKQSGKE